MAEYCNTPYSYSSSVTELPFGHIITLTRCRVLRSFCKFPAENSNYQDRCVKSTKVIKRRVEREWHTKNLKLEGGCLHPLAERVIKTTLTRSKRRQNN